MVEELLYVGAFRDVAWKIVQSTRSRFLSVKFDDSDEFSRLRLVYVGKNVRKSKKFKRVREILKHFPL